MACFHFFSSSFLYFGQMVLKKIFSVKDGIYVIIPSFEANKML